MKHAALTASTTAALLLSLSSVPAKGETKWILLCHDLLVDARPVAGQSGKENVQGRFDQSGWRSEHRDGYLKIGLSRTADREGALEVTLSNIDWSERSMQGVKDRKIHFLNLFSNPVGDHHAEGGGTPTDALWTLRTGVRDGKPRYGNGFKLLWSPRGAKRTPGNQYHEKQFRMPEGWKWLRSHHYRFRVEWSASRRRLTVSANEQKVAGAPWNGEGDPMGTIFLGKAADFRSWQGVCFSDLKVFRRKPSGTEGG